MNIITAFCNKFVVIHEYELVLDTRVWLL